jgi:hypothetical protein
VAQGLTDVLPALQESPVANKIKEAFFSEKGLAGNISKLPFDKIFALDSVKKASASCSVVKSNACWYASSVWPYVL